MRPKPKNGIQHNNDAKKRINRLESLKTSLPCFLFYTTTLYLLCLSYYQLGILFLEA